MENIEKRDEPYTLTTETVLVLLLFNELVRLFIKEIQQIDMQRVLENQHEEESLSKELKESREEGQ